jgi:hypothetical protein
LTMTTRMFSVSSSTTGLRCRSTSRRSAMRHPPSRNPTVHNLRPPYPWIRHSSNQESAARLTRDLPHPRSAQPLPAARETRGADRASPRQPLVERAAGHRGPSGASGPRTCTAAGVRPSRPLATGLLLRATAGLYHPEQVIRPTGPLPAAAARGDRVLGELLPPGPEHPGTGPAVSGWLP